MKANLEIWYEIESNTERAQSRKLMLKDSVDDENDKLNFKALWVQGWISEEVMKLIQLCLLSYSQDSSQLGTVSSIMLRILFMQ